MTDRTVLTTGANSGIGLATTIELTRTASTPWGPCDPRPRPRPSRPPPTEAGVKVETVLLDVTDAEQCEAVLADLDLYGLVNNAGYALTGAIEDVSDDEARHLFETMVFAPMRLSRLALPAMRARGQGRIVNLSSIAGLVSSPWPAGTRAPSTPSRPSPTPCG